MVLIIIIKHFNWDILSPPPIPPQSPYIVDGDTWQVTQGKKNLRNVTHSKTLIGNAYIG